jgi:hypothetical protein
MKPLRVRTPLGLFSVLWAVAAALHHLEAQPLAGLPLYPFVVLLLLYPERIWALAAFSLAHATLLWFDLPAAANHSVLALLVNGCILIGCVQVARAGTAETRSRRLWDSVQGPIRATVAIVYFFAAFHKLNSSFFDPAVSCATSQLAKMFEFHGFPQSPASVSVLGINMYLTLILETAILVFLLWPRFSHVGALLGLLFHTAVAWAQFFDFATVVFALYLFFLPWDAVQREIARLPRWAGACFAGSFVGLSVTSFLFHGMRGNPVIFEWSAWSLQADTLICVFWTLMVWPILLPIFLRGNVGASERRWTGPAVAWLIPVLAWVNGATPYLGLKTVANYSMFSNLRTEGGGTNHFLVPAGRFRLGDYQDDLARIEFIDGVPPEKLPLAVRLAGGERWIRRNARWVSELPGVRVPFMEVRRALQLWRDMGFTRASIAYERNGERFETENAFSDPELMRPLSFWERKLMAFRAVQDDGEESWCRW